MGIAPAPELAANGHPYVGYTYGGGGRDGGGELFNRVARPAESGGAAGDLKGDGWVDRADLDIIRVAFGDAAGPVFIIAGDGVVDVTGPGVAGDRLGPVPVNSLFHPA